MELLCHMWYRLLSEPDLDSGKNWSFISFETNINYDLLLKFHFYIFCIMVIILCYLGKNDDFVTIFIVWLKELNSWDKKINILHVFVATWHKKLKFENLIMSSLRSLKGRSK